MSRGNKTLNIRWIMICACLAILAADAPPAEGRNPIRRNFFDAYPQAVGSVLDTVPSRQGHCGVCHFDFSGGGPRNPYGLAVQGTNGSVAAILGLGGLDSDGDGFTNETEILDPQNLYSNTPTFPGLTADNVGQVSSVSLGDIVAYLTPTIGDDTTPPDVEVLYPAGGESLGSSSGQFIEWLATDDSGTVVAVDVYVSFDGGAHFDPLALGHPNTGELTWFVHNRPTAQAIVRVEATDASNNVGVGESPYFTIYSTAVGRVPTTLRDFDMPGTQPGHVSPLLNPADCAACHSGYSQPEVEPYRNWAGSMMAHASIDPLFLAAVDVASFDAPESADLCLRCHNNRGWLAGRSVPTDGSQMLPADLIGVSCDLCHRMVDPIYKPGISPVEDEAILAALRDVPEGYTAAQFVVDPISSRRGPFHDAVAPHDILVSPFHREAALCGTCHDVSNPVFVRNPDGSYSPNTFDQPASDFGSDVIGPVERTYSEWFYSDYNTAQGVYAPEFGGNRLYVASCQDCHMRAVTGQGCSEPDAPVRDDLPLHDMTGGSTWLPSILHLVDPTVDVDALAAGVERARRMLQLAAWLNAWRDGDELVVRVENRTGHKLPTGYPEGRRMWLNVQFYGRSGLIQESGAYDFDTAELHLDEHAKVYEIHPVVGEDIAPIVGLPPGAEFHFVLNNEVAKDNRIPPLGFTNVAYDSFGGAPVGAVYMDGQNYDLTRYPIPAGATRAEVTLYYQSISREFVEFLRDNGIPGGAGEFFYDLWNDNGKCPPEVMATTTVVLPHRIQPAGTTSGGPFIEKEKQPRTP